MKVVFNKSIQTIFNISLINDKNYTLRRHFFVFFFILLQIYFVSQASVYVMHWD